MRGWYPDPFGRYDERYFIDGHFTDRARLVPRIPRRARSTIRFRARSRSRARTVAGVVSRTQRARAVVTLTLIGDRRACACSIAFVHRCRSCTCTRGGDDRSTAGPRSRRRPTSSTRITRRMQLRGALANRTARDAPRSSSASASSSFGGRPSRRHGAAVDCWGSGGVPQYGRSPMRTTSPDGGETRTCPWCAETIKSAAVICRFCGRVTPSAARRRRCRRRRLRVRSAAGRVDARRRRRDADDVDDADPVFELPVRPTALPCPPAPSPPDVIDVDEDIGVLAAPLDRRDDRADEPEQRDEKPDDEHHPVALAQREDAEGDEQDEVDDTGANAEPRRT